MVIMTDQKLSFGFCSIRVFCRESELVPSPPSSGHGKNFGVTHFLKINSGEGRAITTTAIQDDLMVFVGNPVFNVPFQDTAAEMGGSGNDSLGSFMILADIKNCDPTCFKFIQGILGRNFRDLFTGLFTQSLKSGGVLHQNSLT